jgi:hypothetical protein
VKLRAFLCKTLCYNYIKKLPDEAERNTKKWKNSFIERYLFDKIQFLGKDFIDLPDKYIYLSIKDA